MGSNPAVVDHFVQAFEKVSGVAHIARSSVEIAAHVVAVATEKNAKRVALANLPDNLTGAIAEACVAAGFEVVRDPFLANTLPAAIDQAQVGVTGIAFGIAQTGTLVEIATNDVVRLVSALPRTHIGVVAASNLVEHYDDAASQVRKHFQSNPAGCVVSFMSGPSRTGDIELKLTLGVHGPESAHAIIVVE